MYRERENLLNRFITMQCEFLFSFLVPPSVGDYVVFVLIFFSGALSPCLLKDKVDMMRLIRCM